MAERRLTVFISSTKSDLVEHRDAVKEALLKAGWDPIEMDDFMARSAPPVEVCLEEVAKADLFLGLYAWRYGYVPKGGKRSITEREYEQARKLKKPCFCFVVDDGYPWPDERREGGEAAARLAAFKQRVEKLTIRRFTTPDGLATDVLASLQRWKDEQREEAPPPPAASDDPRRRRLLELLAKVEIRCDESLAERTAPQALDLAMSWRDRRGGPLGSAAPEELRPLPAGGLPGLLREHDRLLIIGPPGSGKTVTLVRLARELATGLKREADPLPPVPVPFPLESWGAEDHDLADWLVRELNDGFALPPRETREWVESGALLPLLDGLDEVAPEDRPRCAAALGEFLETRGGALVAAVRSETFEDLGAVPHVHTEVVLAPLPLAEAEAYLAAAGPGLEAVRDALRDRAELRDLARWPLLLHLMAEAYRGVSSEALDPLRESAAVERPRRLVADFLARMEAAPGRSQRYDPACTRRGLSWLAREMIAHGVSRFEIDRLEPSWLGGPALRWLYALLSRAIGGAALMVPFALAVRPFLLLVGLAAGALVGAVDALPVWRLPASGRARDALVQTGLRIVLLTAGVLALVLGLAHLCHWGSDLYVLGAAVALLFGVVFGPRPGGAHEDIRAFEQLRVGWSWRGGAFGAALAALLILALGLLAPFAEPKMAGLRSIWAILAAAASLPGLVLGGLGAGLEGSFVRVHRRPGLGLRRLLGPAGRVGLVGAGAATAVLVLLLGSFEAASQVARGYFELGWGGVKAIFVCALLAGLWFAGGLDFLQHWTLRLLLSATSPMPLRWMRFLGHAVDRGLLWRVDCAWEFPDRLLRDGFAVLPAEE